MKGNALAAATAEIPGVDVVTAIAAEGLNVAAGTFDTAKGIQAISNGDYLGGAGDIANAVGSVAGAKLLGKLGELGGQAVSKVAIAAENGGRDLLAEARAARDTLGQQMKDLPWSKRPAVFIGAYDGVTGEVSAFGSSLARGGPHAEEVALQEMPNALLTEPMGWRHEPGGLDEWVPIGVCARCQANPALSPGLFPQGTGFDLGGAWNP